MGLSVGGKAYSGYPAGIAESSSAPGGDDTSATSSDEDAPSPVYDAPPVDRSSPVSWVAPGGRPGLGSRETSESGRVDSTSPPSTNGRLPPGPPSTAFSDLQQSSSRRSPSPAALLLPSESSRTRSHHSSHHHHHHSHSPSPPNSPPLLPIRLQLSVRGSTRTMVKMSRTVLESTLLVGATVGGVGLLLRRGSQKDRVGAAEIALSASLALVYVLLRTSGIRPTRATTVNSLSVPMFSPRTAFARPGTPHTSSNLNPSSVSQAHPPEPRSGSRGFVWGTDGRDYRESADDGALTALLSGPLLSVALLITTLRQLASPSLESALPTSSWLVEPPLILLTKISADGSTTAAATEGSPHHSRLALEALAKSRRSMVSLSTLVALVVLISLVSSRWAESVHARRTKDTSENGSSLGLVVDGATVPSRPSTPREREREKWWLPKSEWKRTGSVTVFSFAVSFAMGWLKGGLQYFEFPIWQDLSVVDVVIASLFHQFSMYVCVRLARRGFTLGELGIVAQFSTALFMETVNLTRAKISFDFLTFLATSYVQTYRLPTPLLIFQLALLPGSFLTGILLSPLLVLSRHISQKPIHRLRFPEEKTLHRRYLAAGFYFGAVVIVGGGVGMWTKWQLGWRDPWVWVIWWMMDGQRWWSRGLLLSYWGGLALVSVGGWEMQLAKARKSRNRPWMTVGGPNRSVMVVPSSGGSRQAVVLEEKPPSVTTTAATNGSGRISPPVQTASSSYPPEPIATSAYSATTMMERVPILSLNGRRKFFHGLAVLMFIPGIYVDPAFSHVAFSVAFAFFVFAEYVRYFALYPFGASVHLFLNEFLDHKDSGTAILSHFYLLTGCATGLWLESPSPILAYIGVLTLGIGDAVASIVGRRFGRIRWSASSGKTVEGSVAFFIGVFVPALILELFGIIPHLAHAKFALTIVLASLLEAWSCQNDNLVIPVFTWAVGSLLGV